MAITKSFSKTAKKCTVTFSLPKSAAPNAKVVKVVGDFNDWIWKKGIPLKAGSKEFTGQVELNPGKEYEFRYCIDNKFWDNDWNADAYKPSPFGVDNSIVVVPNVKTASAKSKNVTTAKKGNSSKKVSAKKSTISAATKRKASGVKLDFTCIEGVGPKISQLLMKAGYKDFTALSSAKVKDLRNILAKAGPRFQMHNPSTWAKQAKMASKSQWTKLQEFKDQLK